MISIKRADSANLSDIFNLANKIWQDTYVQNIGQDQVDYMLYLFYSEKALKEKLEMGHDIFTIHYNGNFSGYFHLEHRPTDIFIHKLYIDTSLQHKGLGTWTINHLKSEISSTQKELRLHVNRKNYKAINFYFKNGFTIEGYDDFDIGNGYYMNDFIMSYTKK